MEHSFRLIQGTTRRPRAAERRSVQVSGQLVWKDERGTTRLSRVVTRDISETGVAVDNINGSPIPLYRLVYFQVDRNDRHRGELPEALRRSAVLAAVYRVGPSSEETGVPTGYALRLLVEPPAAMSRVQMNEPMIAAVSCAV